MTVAPEELANLVGDHRVSVHPADLHRHALDRSPAALIAKRVGKYRLPACVVRPHSTEQVAAVLAWADKTGTPVVPYGGGSGVCEQIDPRDVVVIEMRAMEEILHFDEQSRLVTAQAGVNGPDLVKTLSSWDFTLGHEPQSIDISTVGGWVSTRASGQLSARFGGIERLVAGLEAVLPGGRIVRAKITPRRATGPDIASLLIGSEGTLGIITEVTLRVTPIERERVSRCVRFAHLADGVEACRKIAQSDLRPTLVRLYDREDAGIFLRYHENETDNPVLLLAFDGEAAAERAARAVELAGGEPGDAELVAHWWEHRNDAVEDYRTIMQGEGILGPHALVDTMEVSAPWSVLRDLYHSMKEGLSKEADVVGCHLSHVYPDGSCLYFTLASACDSDEAARAKLDVWWQTGMELCLRSGGSISHHHGIGRRKAPWLQEELGGWWEVLVAVKKAIDPQRIMNPGALGL